MSGSPKSDRLDSWKAIANYLGRSVRTARRWELEEGLPVHRQMHQSLASVYAYKSEINAWQTRNESDDRTAPAANAGTVPGSPPEPERASIAVLPFSFLGSDPGDDYIADGFTDEIIADLSKLRSLRVISRTSSMSLKGVKRDARSLARELKVGHLLEGTVRRHDSSIRITVRLVEGNSDHTRWAEKYAGEAGEIFDIQERIAREVANALALRLTREDDARLSQKPIASLRVWRAVVLARREAMRWSRGSIDDAVAVLKDALATEGENAYVYAELGRAYLQYRETGLDLGPEPLAQARHWADRAFAADADAPAGYQLRGWLNYSQGNIQQAVDDLKAALERNGADPDALGLLCNCYLISGQIDLARPAIDRLLSIDPLTPPYRALPAWADTLEGRPQRAVRIYQQMLDNEPGSPMARLFLVWILAITGQAEAAIEVGAGFSKDDAESLPAQVAGQFVAACRNEPLKATIPIQNSELAGANDLFPRMLAQAHALAGDTERAIDWLSVAVDRGFVNFPYLERHDPLLTRLKGEPRYAELLERVRHRWQAFRP